ncbi:PAS domain S-box protein [Geobacter sp.]|uniref:PAS domain S-box protein n=1 Tax=Geobacter sp. TaxID=46610 RepID=UPI0027BADE6D|nr:PAS domain S-box protein [Geobacter sp.]
MPQRSGTIFTGSIAIFTALVIVVVSILGVFAVTTVSNRRISIETAERQTHNLSSAVAMHAEQLFQRIDAALQGVERDVAPLHPIDAAPLKVYDILVARLQVSSNVLAFVILDRNGRVAFTSRTPSAEKVDLSDREYFSTHSRGAGAGLHISAPVMGKVGFSQGRWIIPVSRRLSSPDGSFAGVVAAIVDASALARFYDTIHVGKEGEIFLARRDGIILAQGSQPTKRIGASLAPTSLFRDLVPRMGEGTVHGALFEENVPLIASFTATPSYPVAAVVAFSRSTALAPWKTAALEVGTITFLLTGGLCAAGLYLMRLSTREEAGRRERERLAAERDMLMRRLQLQFDRMPVGCVIMTHDPTVIDLNPAAERIFGYGKSELAGKDPYGLIIPESVRPHLDALLASLDADQTVHGINENITKDGRTITCEWFNTPLRDDKGESVALMAMVRDITDEQKTLAALRESEARYRSFFTGNHAVMLLIDPQDGSIVDANPAACRFYGIPAEELARMNISQINVAEPTVIASEMARANTWECSKFTFKHRLADGIVRDVEVFSGPIVMEGRNFLYSIVIDITERIAAEAEILRLTAQLEDRVRERTAQLEAANKELEAFSYSVSHDLRAPLRHVAGFVELLLKRNATGLDEKSLHYLDVIADSTQRMGYLIDDLLAFSRMGRVDMIATPLDLHRIVQEVITSRLAAAAGREIEWVIGTLPPARGDEAMIRLVFENLIDNAVKFSSVRNRARIEIGGYSDEEGNPVVFVKDNGVGFDMRYAEKLFGLFQRLHRQEDFEGTGVGLANVRRIVHRHGGRVWAEGVVDGGATFYLSLPPDKEAAQ